MIGYRNEMRAVRFDMDGGDAAEGRMARGKHEPAAKFQRTEARQRLIVIVKGRNDGRIDLHACWRLRITQRIGEREGADGQRRQRTRRR